jgi:hypothetical protein
MLLVEHPSTDFRERLKFPRLARQEWISLEVGDDLADKFTNASDFRVRSERSGLIQPQPSVPRRRYRTSARSWFWLTEKLGRISQPNAWWLLRLKVTQKQPSPSTYPVRYQRISTIPSSETPAFCGAHRFGDCHRAPPQENSLESLQGCLRSFPRYYPRPAVHRR